MMYTYMYMEHHDIHKHVHTDTLSVISCGLDMCSCCFVNDLGKNMHDVLNRLPCALQEFFQLLMRDMFDTDYGMFKLDEETRMYWFRASKIDMTMEFELVGTMIGLAIYNSHLLEFSFPMLTYRSVLSCWLLSLVLPEALIPKLTDPSQCQQTACAHRMLRDCQQ